MRQDWVNACHFHDLNVSEVLQEVYNRIVRQRDLRPLVLLDLDSTLYEVGPRTYHILREWVDSNHSAEFGLIQRTLRQMSERSVGYSIRDTFKTVGLDTEEDGTKRAIEVAKTFWSERFFSSAYLPYDRPYRGAAEFAQKIHQLGAEIVYLTGRDAPKMGDGTRANLLRDGFPWDTERTHLLLKPASEVPDLQHKKDAAAYVRKNGTLIASFENEPLNLVSIYEIFPEAMHVFVDTVCSDHAAKPQRGLYRISGFEI